MLSKTPSVASNVSLRDRFRNAFQVRIDSAVDINNLKAKNAKFMAKMNKIQNLKEHKEENDKNMERIDGLLKEADHAL